VRNWIVFVERIDSYFRLNMTPMTSLSTKSCCVRAI